MFAAPGARLAFPSGIIVRAHWARAIRRVHHAGRRDVEKARMDILAAAFSANRARRRLRPLQENPRHQVDPSADFPQRRRGIDHRIALRIAQDGGRFEKGLVDPPDPPLAG
ncbi:MAG: hypothetical protein LBQ62_02465 [Candidatus Accumulibacter sp.]|nr:hypothetical protein [Accumulibacter sp.]